MTKLTVNDLKPGDILLSPPPESFSKGWMGQLIIKLTKGKVSHGVIYCGLIDDEPTIAHAYVRGIEHLPLKDHFEKDETPLCFVRRLSPSSTDMEPILEAANKYIEANNPLAKESFIFLGLILLSKRISENRLHHPALHNFVTMICIKLAKVIARKRSERGGGENAMNCSQFVLQCFEDAGEDYQIEFNKLFLAYETEESLTGFKSLLDYVDKKEIGEARPTDGEPAQTDDEKWYPEMLSPDEEITVKDFMALLDGNSQEQLTAQVDDVCLQKNSTGLAELLYELLTGRKPEPGCDIEDFLLSNKNYIALPNDLLENTKNLTDE